LIHRVEKIGVFEAPVVTNKVYMEIDVLRKHGSSLRFQTWAGLVKPKMALGRVHPPLPFLSAASENVTASHVF
jgi:hypothetical protein